MRKYRKVYLLAIVVIFMIAIILPWNMNDDAKTIIIHSLFVFIFSFFIRKKGTSSLLIEYGKISFGSIVLGYINTYNNHSWHTFGLVVLVSIVSSLICCGGYMLWQHFSPQTGKK